jgi:hypothetical protein
MDLDDIELFAAALGLSAEELIERAYAVEIIRDDQVGGRVGTASGLSQPGTKAVTTR